MSASSLLPFQHLPKPIPLTQQSPFYHMPLAALPYMHQLNKSSEESNKRPSFNVLNHLPKLNITHKFLNNKIKYLIFDTGYSDRIVDRLDFLSVEYDENNRCFTTTDETNNEDNNYESILCIFDHLSSGSLSLYMNRFYFNLPEEEKRVISKDLTMLIHNDPNRISNTIIFRNNGVTNLNIAKAYDVLKDLDYCNLGGIMNSDLIELKELRVRNIWVNYVKVDAESG